MLIKVWTTVLSNEIKDFVYCQIVKTATCKNNTLSQNNSLTRWLIALLILSMLSLIAWWTRFFDNEFWVLWHWSLDVRLKQPAPETTFTSIWMLQSRKIEKKPKISYWQNWNVVNNDHSTQYPKLNWTFDTTLTFTRTILHPKILKNNKFLFISVFTFMFLLSELRHIGF